MKNWIEEQIKHIKELKNKTIVKWYGKEYAIFEKGKDGLPVWYNENIPFLQFSIIDLSLDDRNIFSFGTYQNDTEFGILIEKNVKQEIYDYSTDYSRNREIHELPTGKINNIDVYTNLNKTIAKINILINRNIISLMAGEVEELENNKFRILELDESILIQVNNQLPKL